MLLPMGGDWQVGYILQLEEISLKEVVLRLLKERTISLSSGV